MNFSIYVLVFRWWKFGFTVQFSCSFSDLNTKCAGSSPTSSLQLIGGVSDWDPFPLGYTADFFVLARALTSNMLLSIIWSYLGLLHRHKMSSIKAI